VTCNFCPYTTLSPAVTPKPKDEYCIDSESEFNAWVINRDQEWVQETKTCKPAKINSTKWCEYSEFKRNCPVICDACPSTPCKDQDGIVKIPPKGKEKTCAVKFYVKELCKKYVFAMHCPVTCNFCPYTTLSPAVTPNPTTLTPTTITRFTKIIEEYGADAGGEFGLQVATASSGDEIFITENVGNRIELYRYLKNTGQYSAVTRSDDFAKNFGAKLATSKDGKNLVYAYTTTDGRDKVEVWKRNDGGVGYWVARGNFFLSSENKINSLSVDISDNGKTIMVANNTEVYVYDYRWKKQKWKLRGQKGIEFESRRQVLNASMSPDGLVVAISLFSPGSIKLYKWKERKWKRHGHIMALDKSELGFFSAIKFANTRFTIVVGVSGAFQSAGAVYVYDLHTKFDKDPETGVETNFTNSWELRNDGIVIKGNKKGDRVGRRLSVSGDGKFVAWASNSRAGIVEWIKGKWLSQDALAFSKRPRVALDSNGKYLAVGLPYDDTNVGKLEIFERSY